MTFTMQLAIGLVGNLGLKRPPPKETPQIMLENVGRGCSKHYSTAPRTMKERRAVIGCFLIGSVYVASI